MADKKRFIAPRGPHRGAEKAPTLFLFEKKKKKKSFSFFSPASTSKRSECRSWKRSAACCCLPSAQLLFAIELYGDGNVKVRRHTALRPRAVAIMGVEGFFLNGNNSARGGGGGETLIWELGGLVELHRGRTSRTEAPQVG